jgi:hypothetical protein
VKPTVDPIGGRPPVKYRTVRVREELARFAEAMEEKLLANDHKTHWNTVSLTYLRHRLGMELEELDRAFISGAGEEQVQGEAVDVANFAMMLYDNIRRNADGQDL